MNKENIKENFRVRTKLVERFGDEIIKNSMILNEDILIDIIYKLNPRTLLEIGTEKGVCTTLFANMCKRVYTIDIKNYSIKYDIWRFFGLQNRIKSFVLSFFPFGYDNNKRKLIKKLNFDIAVIDGSHRYESVKFDFDCVKKCGCVLFHDYKPRIQKYSGLVKFVDSLAPKAKIIDGSMEHSKFALWLNENLRKNKRK